MSRIAELCQKIAAAHREAARLERDECDSVPGKPASKEDLDRLREERPGLPEQYLEFLALHDGWEQVSFGLFLYPIDELLTDGQDHIDDILETERENDRDLGDVFGVLWSENDGTMLYIDPADQSFVLYCYEELDRFDSFAAYLESCLEEAEDQVADLRGELDQYQRDRDPDVRAAFEATLEIRAKERFALEPDPEPEPQPGPINLEVVPAYVRRVRWSAEPSFDDPEGPAWVRLTLSLYLGFAPTADEMRRALIAWRATVPSRSSAHAMPYASSFYRVMESPDDQSTWDSLLETHPKYGRYGLAWAETDSEPNESAPDCETFSIRAFAKAEGKPAAPLCLATFPPDTDPEILPRLALALCDVLPVRSGLGGLEARYSHNGQPTAYRWCRQFFGLDLQDANMVYPPLREGVRSASWLTILGPALARGAAEKAKTLPPSVARQKSATGALILRAGDAPDVRHIESGVPESVAAVERLIAPLKIGNPEIAPTERVFKFFQTTDELYGPWLYRYADPTRFLRHTPWELGNLAEEVADEGTEDEIISFAALAASAELEPDERHLPRHLYNAGIKATQRELPRAARALYEACAEMPHCLVQAYGNLIVNYTRAGMLEQACDLADSKTALGDPYIFFNGACAYAERGDADRTFELLRAALDAGLDRPELLETDDSLTYLRDDPRLKELINRGR